MSANTIYRVTRRGIQAIARPAVLRWDDKAVDFESLELARVTWAQVHGFKPRLKFSPKKDET